MNTHRRTNFCAVRVATFPPMVKRGIHAFETLDMLAGRRPWPPESAGQLSVGDGIDLCLSSIDRLSRLDHEPLADGTSVARNRFGWQATAQQVTWATAQSHVLSCECFLRLA